MSEHDHVVKVFVNGKALMVPRSVGSWWALRGVLGVPRGMAIGIKSVEGLALLGDHEHESVGRQVRSWTFNLEDQYEIVEWPDELAGYDNVILKPDDVYEEDDEDKADWRPDPEAWKDGG